MLLNGMLFVWYQPRYDVGDGREKERRGASWLVRRVSFCVVGVAMGLRTYNFRTKQKIVPLLSLLFLVVAHYRPPSGIVHGMRHCFSD